jgi:hypothetical protein
VTLHPQLFVEARGGVAIELITIERQSATDERAHLAPYGTIGFGTRL